MSKQITIRDFQRNRNRSQRLTRLTLLLVGLVLLAGSLYSLALFILSRIAGMDPVASVTWEQTISGTAWSFQREYVTHTDQECILIPMVSEGDRVSKGLEVARLNFSGGTWLNEPGNRRLYSQIAGIVSFAPDGLELVSELRDYQALTIGELDMIVGPSEPAQRNSQGLVGLIQDKVQAESLGGDGTGGIGAGAGVASETGGTTGGADTSGQADAANQASGQQGLTRVVPAHSAVMKVTDNLSDCYLYLRLPAQEEAPFIPGDRVNLRGEGDGERVGDGRGFVLQCEDIPGGWGLLLRLESGLEAVRHSRRHRLEIRLGAEERCAVPIGTVVMKDGEVGIYAVEKNRARWTPVVLVDEQNGYQIIEGLSPGSVNPGDVAVTRPWLIWDGMRLQG